MDSIRYKIVFEGAVADGRRIEAVKENLVALFKTSRKKIDWMFLQKRLVLKKDLDHTTASTYLRAFEHAGIVCRLEEVETSPATVSAPRSSIPPDPTPSPGAPKGKRLQSREGIVSLCIAGLVLGLYLASPKFAIPEAFKDASVDNIVLFALTHFPGICLSAAGILLCLFGLIIGIAGLIETQRKRLLPMAGMALNISTAVVVGTGMVGMFTSELSNSFSPTITIPVSESAYSQKEFNRKQLGWMLRRTVDPFNAKVPDSVSWKQEAGQFLEDVCKTITDQADCPATMVLQAKGKSLIDLGCDDPLVALWYGWTCFRNKQYEKAENSVAPALDTLTKSTYPKIHTFYAGKTLNDIAQRCKDTSHSTIDRWKKAAMRTLAGEIASGSFRKSEAPIAFRLANETFDDQEMVDFRRIAEDIGHINRWLLLMIQGSAEIQSAWLARGSGWGDTVTEDGWKGFREHLEKANQFLGQAWKLHPEYPEAAAEMITVAMGGKAGPGDNEYTWFNRCVNAQIDYQPAYIALLWAIEPRWGGSVDQMLHFGEACLQTNRFDTDVPLFFLRALRSAASLQKHNGWRDVFRRPGVHGQLEALYAGLLNDPNRAKDAARIRVQQGLTEAWCGNHARAEQMLENLLGDIELTDGFWGKSLSWSSRKQEMIEAELRAFNGPDGAMLKKAENICADTRIEEALLLFESAMVNNRADLAVHAYLRDRIALTRMEDQPYAVFPPLYFAALENRPDVAAFLIDNGVDVNERNNHGNTALHAAARKGHMAMVKLLLDHRAEVNARNNQNEIPLHRALRNEFEAIATLLMDAGSRINIVSVEGWSPLHLAVRNNQPDAASRLIKEGADIAIPNQQLWTPLHMALQYTDQHISTLLVQKGADVNASTREGWRPLHTAIYNQHADMAELLLQHGANVNVATFESITPLHIAASWDLAQVVEQLAQHGAAIDAVDLNGWSPLHVAAYRGCANSVAVLLYNGADRELRQDDGRTPLMLAQSENNAEAVATFHEYLKKKKNS